MENNSNSNTLVVCGKKNVGKTTALNLAMNEIINNFTKQGATIDGPHNWGRCNDLWVKINYQGKAIGINTRGDSEYWVKEGLIKLGKCDYYICASHLFGETVDAFLEKQDEYGMKNIVFLNKVGFGGRSIDRKLLTVAEVDRLENDNKQFTEQIINIFYRVIYS